jgi:hypothetical protein
MFAVVVAYDNSADKLELHYKTREAAETSADQLIESKSTNDDFGQSIQIFGELSSLIISDLDQALDVAIENNIMQMKGQAKYQQKAAADPFLRLMGNSGGGNILNPIGRS